MTFAVLTAMPMKDPLSWDVTSCGMV